MSSQRHTYSIMLVIMGIISLVVVTASAVYTGLLVHYRTNTIVKQADARLLEAAELNREILGPDYHDRIVDAGSVSKEEFSRIVAKNDDLCRRLNLQYLWSVLLANGRVVFTSATHSDLNAPNSACAAFFETHRDPESFAPALQPELQPAFCSFKNEWGEGRQVLIPHKDARGRTYIFGASVQMDDLNAVVSQTILGSIWIGLGILCGAFLLALILARSFTAPIAKLTAAAGRMATGDLDVSLPQTRAAELHSLSQSLDVMRRELKKQLASLRQNEALLAHSQQIANIGSWDLDVAGNRLTWSDETYRIFGIAPQEFAATYEAFLDAVHPADRATVATAFSGSLSQGKDTYEIEHRVVRRCTGEIRYVHEKGVHVRNEAGDVVRSRGMVQDITERRLFEIALQKSEETALTILNATADAVMLIDCDGILLAVNDAIADQLGSTRDEIVGKSIDEVFPPRMRESIQAILEKVVATGASLRLEDNYTQRVLDVVMYPVLDKQQKVARLACFARDITAQRKTEEALRLSYERLRAYFDLPLMGIATTSKKKGWLDINPKLCDMLGYTETELRTKKWQDLTPAEDLQAEDEMYAHMLSGATTLPFTFEKRYKKKNGDIITAEITTDRIKGSSPGEDYFISFIHDITDRKRAEQELVESQRTLKTLMGNLQGLAYRCNNDDFWTMEFFSEGARELTGYAPDAFINNNRLAYADIIHPDDRPLVYDIVQEAVASKRQFQMTYRILTAEGAVKWVLEKGTGVFSPGGELLCLEGFITDISERRRYEEALRESESVLRSVIDNLPVEFWARDLDERCILENPALVRHWGSILNKRPEDTGISPQALAIWKANNRRAFSGEVVQGEVAYEVEGRKRIFQNIIAPIYTDGAVHGLVGFNFDVTDRKQAEEALQQKNDELIRFNYTVSHDLRSPLVTIKTFAGFLVQDLTAADMENVMRDLGYINTAADKMNALLEELLDLSRVGRMVNPPVEASLQVIVQEALELVAGRIAERNVQVVVVQEPCILYGDRPRIVEVFQNLVDNAVKFMGEQKEPLIEIGVEIKSRYILCFVRDNGMGIDPRHKGKLFGFFEKLDAGSQGTGLGLVLAKRIVELHGGRIWVESEGLGKGACFWFTLPQKPVQS